MREGLFALAYMEEMILHGKEEEQSHFIDVLETAMLAEPKNWQKHREKVQKEKQKNEKAQKEKERSESAQGRSDEKEPSARYSTQNPQEQWDGGQVKDRTFTGSQTAPQDGTNRPDRAADDCVASQNKAAPSTADTRTQKQGTHVQLQTGGQTHHSHAELPKKKLRFPRRKCYLSHWQQKTKAMQN